ncbi:MAG: hypothetical protein EBZ53_05015 [Verrucomicrobia bacterium]|nr:hypothetical protein [Verrucomicrobiota bacterium]
MIITHIARLEVEALREFLEMENCQPGRLMDSNCSPLYWVMNQMLYDKFHGHGWDLDLVTGRFVRTQNQ